MSESPMSTRPEFGLGRVAKPDPRDRRFMLASPRTASVRTARTWYVRGVLDQGSTPHCVGYSSAQWCRASPAPRVVNLVPSELYAEAQRLDEWEGEDYDGSSVRGGMKALRARGIVESFTWAFDPPTLIHHLLETGPMVLGTDWYESMFEPDAKGNLTVEGATAGGHAYLAIGIDTRHRNADRSVGAVRIVNSWGTRWGQAGRAWLPFSALPQLLENYGEAAMGVKRRG